MKLEILAVAMLLSPSIFGQKQLTLEITVPGSPEFVEHYNRPVRGFFIDGTDDFVLVGDTTYTVGGHNWSRNQIKQILTTCGYRNLSYVISFTDTESAWVYSEKSEAAFLVNINKREICDSITELEDFESLAPDGKHATFTIGNNLYVAGRNGKHRINAEQEYGVVYGQAVHRNEWGIEDGTFWSPNGKLLAFYRMDESMVGEYPIVDITAREAEFAPIRYPMAGEQSHQVQIGIYNTETQNVIYLKTESPVDRFFTNISWSPNDKYILVAELNRGQNHMWMNMYNAENGQLVKTIFEEENPEWVEPCTPALFVNNTDFVWLSERDGFRHLYLYNVETQKCKQLTQGNWCVTDLYGFNASTGEVLLQANEQGYMTRDIYKVNLKGRLTRLSSGYGVHHALMGKNLFVDNFSSPETAITSTMRSMRNGNVTDTLKHIKNTYDGYTLPQFHTVNLKSADGQFDLCGRLILPADFDSTKTYPVIDYMYGGPHSQLVDASWLYGASTWKMYFAQQGYIIFTMDNRGTEYRGVKYEHCIHRQLGKCEMEDQMQGIRYLKSLPYVDTTRIGIHGWSFGGFMTISMMLHHNTEFKAGVAGGPVCDWSLYEVMYGERYMDTPQENPEGYQQSRLTDKTGDLRGRLLVIHGDIDPVVVWQNSLQLMQNAVDNDVLIDYAVYPQHEHNVLGTDRVHLFKRILQYFDDFLK